MTLEMKVAIGVIVFLAAVLVAQQVFWLANVQRLINKMLSKNYTEYVQAEMIKSPLPVRRESKETKEFVDEFSVGQAERANTMFGFGGGTVP